MELHQEFAKAAAKQSVQIEEVASMWAAWMMVAHNERMSIADACHHAEHEGSVWNSAQKKFWFVVTALDNVTYQEIKKLLIAIDDVNEIFSVGTHMVWMYAGSFIREDCIDKWLEKTDECSGCYYQSLIKCFHYMITDYPYSLNLYEAIAHADENWEFLHQCFYEQMPQFVKLFEEYKVEWLSKS